MAGSGSGRVFPDFGINVGEYTFEATLIVGDPGVAETIVGDDGDETLDGGRADDIVAGGYGNDIILGGEGTDILRGDLNSRTTQDGDPGGNDIIFGGSGNDMIGGRPATISSAVMPGMT